MSQTGNIRLMEKSTSQTTGQPRPAPPPRQWDARLARLLVTPLMSTWVTPNHLTTVRLLVGVASALAFGAGSYRWVNIGAFLLVASNFIDHTDGELARISGKTSRIGHFYDLAADAFVTVALFAGIGAGVARAGQAMFAPPLALGCVAGVAVALIFFLRMRIEECAGKAGTRQASVAGFEMEDVLYLMPVVTLAGGVQTFLYAASIGAPLFALWVIVDYWRTMRRVPDNALAGTKRAAS
jgi:archaetidylinositol phosphate synthase